MQQRRMSIYGAIAIATPLVVLANTLLSSADRPRHPVALPLRPLLEQPIRLAAAIQTLAMAYHASMMHPYACIVEDHGQLFLEFSAPFKVLDQSPELTLALVTDSFSIQHSLPLGTLQTTASQHRYAIPAVDDIGQYPFVIIWCVELNTILGYAPLEVETSIVEQHSPTHKDYPAG